MRKARIGFVTMLLVAVSLSIGPRCARAADSGESKALREIQRELKRLEQDRERDLDQIKTLAQRVQQLESENNKLKASNAQITHETAATTATVKTLQTKVQEVSSPTTVAQQVQGYLGTHTFTLAGSAGMDFIYDQQSAAPDGISHQTQNSFFLDWEPLFLYRPNDWMLFEGVMSFAAGQTGTGADLSSALFYIFPNDYVTLVGGVFDMPFGDWYEDQSPMWVNRFITAPLPFGVEPVVPPADMGVQLRNGYQWGKLGQDLDYTVWMGEGPSFTENVPGAAMGGPTAAGNKQTNGEAFGGRFRVYPFPVDSNLGRLELGASTYDGKWYQGNWLTSWGLDFAYLNGNLQARGEWVQSYRQMQAGFENDNRTGWYLQIGYFLSGVNLSFLPDKMNDYIHRLEPVIRYSGVNQHFVAIDDIEGATGEGLGGFQVGLIPDFGLSGSPALYAPHSREVALGLDYWVAPSIVWQNEFDIELPHAGGMFIAGDGTPTPVGAYPNDHAFLTQFTIGF